MKQEKIDDFLRETGECLQNIMYYTETGRKKEAKSLQSKLTSLRETAKQESIEIVFFEKRSYVRKAHPDFPNLKTKFSEKNPMGAWTLDEETKTACHAHMTVELVIDATSGHPEVYPGDIEIEESGKYGAEESSAEKSDKNKTSQPFNDKDFLWRLGIRDDLSDTK